eukprot:COSAG05_NODE_548_length_8749_cov_33.055838_9_plen_117_part_00
MCILFVGFVGTLAWVGSADVLWLGTAYMPCCIFPTFSVLFLFFLLFFLRCDIGGSAIYFAVLNTGARLVLAGGTEAAPAGGGVSCARLLEQAQHEQCSGDIPLQRRCAPFLSGYLF